MSRQPHKIILTPKPVNKLCWIYLFEYIKKGDNILKFGITNEVERRESEHEEELQKYFNNNPIRIKDSQPVIHRVDREKFRLVKSIPVPSENIARQFEDECKRIIADQKFENMDTNGNGTDNLEWFRFKIKREMNSVKRRIEEVMERYYREFSSGK